MIAQGEALRLAEILEGGSRQFNAEAAAELRRLHAQRDALLEALKELTGHTNKRFTGGVWDRARAAIKAVEGEKT